MRSAAIEAHATFMRPCKCACGCACEHGPTAVSIAAISKLTLSRFEARRWRIPSKEQASQESTRQIKGDPQLGTNQRIPRNGRALFTVQNRRKYVTKDASPPCPHDYWHERHSAGSVLSTQPSAFVAGTQLRAPTDADITVGEFRTWQCGCDCELSFYPAPRHATCPHG